MSLININSISGINSITDQSGSGGPSGVSFFNSTGALTSINVSSITISSNFSANNVTATGIVSAANVSASSSITAAQYNFSTQGFNFELKDGLLTPTNKTKYTFPYTGSNQTFTVPAGVNWIYVKLWGAGGGAGRAGGWSYGADGGGGGHVRGLFPVTPSSTILVVVGRGGTLVNGTTQGYGGGGTNGSASDNSYGGHGGGYCGVFVTSASQANALAIAGGGGGGGSSRAWFGNLGGAGGGLVGQRGMSPYDAKFTAGGNAGTQSAGGAATSGYSGNGSAGSALQGGAGSAASYGGGGGGGYYGGGGGAYSETNTMAGGGGGSGFVKSTGLLTATYTGNYRMVAIPQDPDLLTTSTTDIQLPGFGGQNTQNNQAAGGPSGGHAYAVIYY
jgi:hypothetical protein